MLNNRHSMRCFLPKPVSQGDLRKILLAANSAPSAGDLQAYKIFVAKKRETRIAIAKAASQDFLCEPPVILVFFADAGASAVKYGKRGETLYSIQDAAIACSYAQLATAALGLSSVWVGGFDSAEAKKACGKEFAKAGLVPVSILPVGFASAGYSATSRKPLADVAIEEKD